MGSFERTEMNPSQIRMPPNHADRPILVYGAYGHTGRFIVAELIEKGFTPVLSGRDPAKLASVSAVHGKLQVRAASLEDPKTLELALAGVAGMINAAGPFAMTAARLVDAAICARLPYLDVAAEPDVVAATMEQYANQARNVGIASRRRSASMAVWATCWPPR